MPDLRRPRRPPLAFHLAENIALVDDEQRFTFGLRLAHAVKRNGAARFLGLAELDWRRHQHVIALLVLDFPAPSVVQQLARTYGDYLEPPVSTSEEVSTKMGTPPPIMP